MMNPFDTAKAIPEGNRVVRVFIEKGSKILRDYNGL